MSKTPIPPISECPEVCPCCGEKDSCLTAVDLTHYNGQDLQYNGSFDVEGSPGEQPIRCYCSECNTYFQLTEAYANQLASGYE